MPAFDPKMLIFVFVGAHATEHCKHCRPSGSGGLNMLQHKTDVDRRIAVELDDGWELGTATFYGDGGSGGHCGGSELGDYGTGQSWIDGLYVATSSAMWCGSGGGSCGNTHAVDCGRCYEVRCTGTDTNTDGYVPCTESTVTVAVTDECPGGSALLETNDSSSLTGHCGGSVRHFDLSTKAFKIIGNTRAGVIKIEFRRVSCAAVENLKLRFHGSQWHFKVAPWDVNGPGTLSSFEVKNANLGSWTLLKKSYGAFWLSDSNIGEGPYELRLTADDGQVLLYTLHDSISSWSGKVLDIGKNFKQMTSTGNEPSPLTAPAPTSTPSPPEGGHKAGKGRSGKGLTPSSQPNPTPNPAPSPEMTPEPTAKPAPHMGGGGKCASAWGQCGGKEWSGTTCCEPGYECVFDNEWYSQCKPEAASNKCAAVWEQCGGEAWTGKACCIEGNKCLRDSRWYSQCKPA